MDITLVTIILVASLVLAPLVLLVISGQLIRSRMHLPATTGRGKRHLQGLEGGLVEFIARSKASSCILTVLGACGKPVGFNAIVEEIRAEQERRRDDEELPKSALRTVLTILQVARLISMNLDGFSLTELGREVYQQSATCRFERLSGNMGVATTATHRAPSSALYP